MIGNLEQSNIADVHGLCEPNPMQELMLLIPPNGQGGPGFPPLAG